MSGRTMRLVSTPPRLDPVRAVVGFGLVSLFADMVYEGARSLYGPVLFSLGASAALVGLIAGAGEAAALVLRLLAGPLADRRGAHWSFTIGGYATTAVCVPLLALAPRLGAAGLAFAVAMILLERTGKALRSPSKSALLAHAARRMGRGRGFGLHKALDQVGAFAGPLAVTAVIAAAGGALWPGLAWLAVPGVLAMAVLFGLRWAIPDPAAYDAVPARLGPVDAGSVDAASGDAGLADDGSGGPGAVPERASWWRELRGADLPPAFFRYALAAALTTGGLATFAVISVRLTRDLGVSPGQVPLWYAGAMLVEAGAALVTGRAYDRVGPRSLLVVPVLVALVPALAFTSGAPLAGFGVAVWGAVAGIQDSTIKALVAELVPAARLATAYGLFAAIQGALAIVGGLVVGALLDVSVPLLIGVVVASQVAAVLLLVAVMHRRGSVAEAPARH